MSSQIVVEAKTIHALASTHKTQGRRTTDFCFVPDGELLTFGLVCDRDRLHVDGPCGCARSMSGVLSRTATTTMEVIELESGQAAYEEAVRQSLVAGGWTRGLSEQEINVWVDGDVKELIRVASSFPVGTILELRGEVFQEQVLMLPVPSVTIQEEQHA